MSSGLDEGAVDRISDLPKSVIGYIISFLPTKDTVATSLLSKSWRLVWTTEVTTFDVEAAEYVDKVLLNMNVESISKFRLRWKDGHSVGTWFDAAISAIPRAVRVLKVLDLVSEDHSRFTKLPPEIFTCKNLEVLKLDGLFVELPNAVCLPKLTELELNSVGYHRSSEITVSELISRCPVLQSLTIKNRIFTVNDRILTVSSLSLKRLCISVFFDFPVDRELTIDAPALEYLFLHDSASKVVFIPGSVNEVDLKLDLYNVAQADKIVELLETFLGVEFLKLSNKVMWALDMATKKLSASLEKLTKLVVYYDHSNHRLNKLVDLMDVCVNLQVLEIYNGSSPSWRSPVVFPRCLSSSLRTLEVTFKPSNEDGDEGLEMIEFILNHGLVLERVHICCDYDLADWEVEEILEKVLMMPKASPTCEIFHRIGHFGALKPLLVPQQFRKGRIQVMERREKWRSYVPAVKGSSNRRQYRYLR